MIAGDFETINSQDVNEIMKQLHTFGSVVAIMEVFEDFYVLGEGINNI